MSILDTLLKLVNPKALSAPAGESQTAKGGSIFSDETIVAGLTPHKLAAILKDADVGNTTEFLQLAADMEIADPHYRSVLSTRKLAVAGIAPEVVAAGEDKASQEQADFVREIVEAPQFSDLVTDLLDGLGKGYGVVETEWDTSGNRWMPAHYVWRDPRGFKFDRATRQVMARDEKGEGLPLEPFRFAVHVPKLVSGLPYRGALGRIAAWAFLFKNYTIKDWMRFTEVYGMPLRVGKYGPNATEEDKRKLLRAITNMGSDAAAIVPQSMMVEFVQTMAGTGSMGPVFDRFADYLDKQVSKAVLGQTMTSDDGSSKAQATVHNDVRMDIKAADARQVMMTLQRDLIIPAVALNFGQQQKYPQVRLPVEEAEDVTAWTDNAGKMMDRGVAVSLTQVREKLGLDEPKGTDDEVTGKAPATDPAPVDPKAAKSKSGLATRHPASCPCCGGLALASQQDQDEIDRLVAQAMEEGVGDLDGLIEPVLKLAAEAKSYDDFIARLSRVAGEQDAGALIGRLQPLMAIGRGLGDATDKQTL